MSMDILVAKIAGCVVMRIPIRSVTSYLFHEEFVVFLGIGVGMGFMSVCNWWFIFTTMILNFRV